MKVIDVIPRLMSSVDTDVFSDTFGCFDKAYWHYKTKDFPCSRLQEAALGLALLYDNKLVDGFYHDEDIKKLCIGALNFTMKQQNADGSFDEWYPNERSYCATAFVTYAMSEIAMMFGVRDHNREMIKAARWLARNKEKVGNQLAGALAAIYNVHKLTGDKALLEVCKGKVEVLKQAQNKEGWIDEYEGADVGYLTVTIHYLAKYLEKSADKSVLPVLEKALEFLKYFIHPDGSLGGVYGSRGTSLCFPFGIKYMSKFNKDAKLVNNVIDGLTPDKMDDRYALVYLVPYIESLLVKGMKAGKLEGITKDFPEAGLVVRKDKYHLICNAKKGGVFRLFKCGKAMDDSGIVVRRGKKVLAAQWNNASYYNFIGNKIVIKGQLMEINPVKTLTPFRNVILGLGMMTVGKSSMISKMIKAKLRKKMILRAKKSKVSYTREIELLGNGIKVVDTVVSPGSDTVLITKDFRSNYVPTSRFLDKVQGVESYKAKNKEKIIITRNL